VNSSYGPDRTLVTKEGRCGKFLPPTSSLPEWFHPNYYESADKIYMQLRRPPSATAQVPFKSTGRYPSEVDDMDKTRKRILETKLNFLQTASYAGSQAPTDQQTSADSSVENTTIPTDYYYYSIYSNTQPRTTSPRYASPRRCNRPHSQLAETGSFNPSNPWTANSSNSTINSVVHHGNCASPRSIHLTSMSCSSLPSGHSNGYVPVDELNSQYFDQAATTYRSSTSSIHSNTNPTMYTARGEHDVSLSTVDSLLIKAATRQKNRYKVPDYTLGALDQQSTSRLIIPPMEFPELDEEINLLTRLPTTPMRPSSSSSSPVFSSFPTLPSPTATLVPVPLTLSSTPVPLISANQRPVSVLNNLSKTIREKEKEKQMLESLYAVTTAEEGVASNTEVIRKEKKTNRNKANQTLDSIQSSRVTKSSLVMDEMIPFDTKMTGYINQWTQERNFVDSDIMRPRQCIYRYPIDGKKKKKERIESSPSEESPMNSLSLDFNDDQSSPNEEDFSPREIGCDSNDSLEDSSIFSA
jgi:hypothetical protein